jgi:putative ABC transport system substrate-binding protein
MPAIYPFRPFVDSGGLMSYGFEPLDLFRRSAAYVDRILRGENPGDLPVQLPTRFEFFINRRAARALGRDFSDMLLARAEEVIE